MKSLTNRVLKVAGPLTAISLVAAGFWLITPGLGLIAAGLLLAVWLSAYPPLLAGKDAGQWIARRWGKEAPPDGGDSNEPRRTSSLCYGLLPWRPRRWAGGSLRPSSDVVDNPQDQEKVMGRSHLTHDTFWCSSCKRRAYLHKGWVGTQTCSKCGNPLELFHYRNPKKRDYRCRTGKRSDRLGIAKLLEYKNTPVRSGEDIRCKFCGVKFEKTVFGSARAHLANHLQLSKDCKKLWVLERTSCFAC